MREPRLVGWAVLLLGGFLAASGCKDPSCADGPTSVQVLLVLAADIASADVSRVEASVTAGGKHRTVDLDTTPLVRDGRGTFVAYLGDLGQQGFSASIEVLVYDSSASLIARGSDTFDGTSDGCNEVTLRLGKAASDGGADAAPAQEAGSDALPTVDSAQDAPPAQDVRTDTSDGASADVVEKVYTWVTGSWAGCSVNCGGGTRTRTVSCKDESGAVVDDSLCAGSKPAGIDSCNTGSCTIHEGVNCAPCPIGYTAQGGACNGKFSCDLEANWHGRWYDTANGKWVDGCAICNSGGGIQWQIYILP